MAGYPFDLVTKFALTTGHVTAVAHDMVLAHTQLEGKDENDVICRLGVVRSLLDTCDLRMCSQCALIGTDKEANVGWVLCPAAPRCETCHTYDLKHGYIEAPPPLERQANLTTTKIVHAKPLRRRDGSVVRSCIKRRSSKRSKRPRGIVWGDAPSEDGTQALLQEVVTFVKEEHLDDETCWWNQPEQPNPRIVLRRAYLKWVGDEMLRQNVSTL